MTEKFDSQFHKKYVGGEGEVVEKEVIGLSGVLRTSSYETILAEYRWYVRDPNAELPEEIVTQLELFGIINNQ